MKLLLVEDEALLSKNIAKDCACWGTRWTAPLTARRLWNFTA